MPVVDCAGFVEYAGLFRTGDALERVGHEIDRIAAANFQRRALIEIAVNLHERHGARIAEGDHVVAEELLAVIAAQRIDHEIARAERADFIQHPLVEGEDRFARRIDAVELVPQLPGRDGRIVLIARDVGQNVLDPAVVPPFVVQPFLHTGERLAGVRIDDALFKNALRRVAQRAEVLQTHLDADTVFAQQIHHRVQTVEYGQIMPPHETGARVEIRRGQP